MRWQVVTPVCFGRPFAPLACPHPFLFRPRHAYLPTTEAVANESCGLARPPIRRPLQNKALSVNRSSFVNLTAYPCTSVMHPSHSLSAAPLFHHACSYPGPQVDKRLSQLAVSTVEPTIHAFDGPGVCLG